MIIKAILGLLIGAGIGAVIGHFGKCSSGGCPLTANPFRGAIYGGVMSALFAFSSGGASRPAAPPTGDGAIHIATREEFDRHIVQAAMPCLVDFYSDHCPPCRRLAPTIGILAEKYRGRAAVCKVNVDTAPELAMPYGIDAIPAVLFFAGGEEVQREIGLHPQATYERILDQMLQPTPTQEK